MYIFDNIIKLINSHIIVPLYQYVDNLNNTIAELGFDYMPEYTVFFTLLLGCALTAFLIYVIGYILYLVIATIHRKVFKL